MILRDIIHSIESVAPLSYQEQWDNSGMQVGDTGMDVRAILLTTDITEAVVREAISLNCQLIISHHPLIFQPLRQLCGQTPQARCVELALRHNTAIYSSHTAMDSYLHGVSGRIAETLGIRNYRILSPAEAEYGLGVIGDLPQAMTENALLQLVSDKMQAEYIRFVSGHKKTIQRIAICGGSGAEFIEEAIAQQADAYITADCKYHEFQAAEGRIFIIDLDHWTSEHFTRDIFREILESQGLKCYISKEDKSPVHIKTK